MTRFSPCHLALFTCLFCLHLTGTSPLHAQQWPLAHTTLDGSKVKAILWNDNNAFWNRENYQSGYEVPKGSGKHSVFSSSLWIGGADTNGLLHLSAQLYGEEGFDFFPGPIREDGHDYPMPRQVPLEYGSKSQQGLRLPDGTLVFQIEGGLHIYDPSTGMATPVPVPLKTPPIANPAYAGGKVYAHFRNIPGTEDYLVSWTPGFIGYTVACTLQHIHAQPVLVPFSTGEVLIAGDGWELLDPSTGTTTLLTWPTLHGKAKAIPFAGDSVLIVGGTGTATTWYHHSTGAFRAGPTLAMAHTNPAVVPYPGGGWLVAGGPTLVTEVIDKYGNSATPGPNLDDIMINPVGALTPGGTVVLMAGEEVHMLHPGASAFVKDYLRTRYILPNATQLTHMEGPYYLISLIGMGYVYFDFDLMRPENGLYQKLWKLNRADIDSFLTDWSSASLDYSKYPDVASWPAKGRFWEGEPHLLAPFMDVNGNGKYNPSLEGDYPCITGEQTVWHVYYDDGEHTQTGGRPLGIDVLQTSYVFDQERTSCPDTLLDYATFYHLEITNRSQMPYSQVMMGFYLDSDIGDWQHDYIGTDVDRQLAFAYKSMPSSPFPEGYGDFPPALGFQLLKGPKGSGMDYTTFIQNDFTDNGNPSLPLHYYNLMRNRNHVGAPMDNGCGGTAGPDYVFPGDAGWCGGPQVGCSEVSAGSIPFDRRILVGMGPFDFLPGETIKLDYALLWVPGDSLDNLSAVCKLQQTSDNIVGWWDAQTFDCFQLIIGTEEAAQEANTFTLSPNPNAGECTLQWEKPTAHPVQVTVTDLQGRPLLQRQATTGTQRMAFTHALPAGIYLVHAPGYPSLKMVVQ